MCEKNQKLIKGIAYFGKSTKQLLHQIPPQVIIIIQHEDIDIVAAEEMVRKKVRAVINMSTSITGILPRSGVSYLVEHNIPVFDLDKRLPEIGNKLIVKIKDEKLYLKSSNHWMYTAMLKRNSEGRVDEKIRQGLQRYDKLFSQFAVNSFRFATEEIPEFLTAVNNLPKLEKVQGNNVFIIGRGKNVENEIRFIRPCFKEKSTIIFAIDGAAAILSRNRIKADYIIGDMDSVPDNILRYSGTFIAHSYLNGKSPGQERLKQLSIESQAVPFPGLSEDLAIMLAYISGAEHIYTLGCRNSVVELTEKGREGMGSTILTRMYTGEKISDCKELSRLFIDFGIKDQTLNSLPNSNLIKEYHSDDSRRNHTSL